MTEPVSLPTKRTSPFDPPPELATLREHNPVSRLALPDGTEGWLVTSHAAVREALADRRFSARQGEPAPGFFVRMDPPEHTRYRKLLTGQFTQRRMRALAGWIEDNGYRTDGTAREVYLVSHPEPEERWQTELQMPIVG